MTKEKRNQTTWIDDQFKGDLVCVEGGVLYLPTS